MWPAAMPGIVAGVSDSDRLTGMPGRKRKTDTPHEVQLPSGRHGLSREFVADNQRERIIKALVATIVSYGYSGCSVEQIAKRAGVSRRTFYEQFAGKEDAYLQAYDQFAGCLLARVDAAWEQDIDGAAQLHLWLETLLESVAGEPHLARVFIADVLSAGPQALERREVHMHDFAIPLERAATAHNGAPPPPLATDGLVAAIYDILYKRVAQDRTEELPDLLDDLHSFCLMVFQYSASPNLTSRS
jgi:AcrR family transcriptional regulator